MGSEYVKSWGGYADYDQPPIARWQWLVSSRTADILSNTLAVFITLAAKGSFTIVKRGILAIGERWPNSISPEVLEVVRKAHSPEGLFYRLFKSLFGGIATGFFRLGQADRHCRCKWPSLTFLRDTLVNFKERRKELRWGLVIAFFMAFLYIGIILLSIFSALVATDSVAVSSSPECGLYFPNDINGTLPNPYWSMWQQYYYDIEMDSGEYARKCYNEIDAADGCNYFYEQAIPYSVKHNDTCPFKSDRGYLCSDGQFGAFALSTGVIRPEAIGINTPLKYTFQRQVTCSPLRMDNDFIKPYKENQTFGYRYFYGHRTGYAECSSGFSNCSFQVPFAYDIGSAVGYTVLTTKNTPMNQPGWRPLFETNATAGEVASLILVSSGALRYPSRSEDPIFPAETTWDNKWYFNTRLHAGVLGCMDRTKICTPDGSFCRSLSYWDEVESHGNEESMVLSYLSYALMMSTMGEAIEYRQESALDANLRRSGMLSLALEAEQWKVEARQLFQTSLARIQIDARNIARGNRYIPIYERVNQMDRIPRLRDLCGMYKFKSTGWRNISITGFLGAIFAGTIVLLLSRTTKDEKLRVEGYYKALRDFNFLDYFTKWWQISGIARILKKNIRVVNGILAGGMTPGGNPVSAASHGRLHRAGDQISDGITLNHWESELTSP